MDWHGLPGLMRDFPGWEIELHELGTAWTAVRHSGAATRVLVAHDIGTLRCKLEQATAEDTP